MQMLGIWYREGRWWRHIEREREREWFCCYKRQISVYLGEKDSCLLINCQTICDRFDLWLVYLYQHRQHNACALAEERYRDSNHTHLHTNHICVVFTWRGWEKWESWTLRDSTSTRVLFRDRRHRVSPVTWHFSHFSEQLKEMWNTVLYCNKELKCSFLFLFVLS